MEKLFKQLNIKPNNIALYNQAFVHSSYAYEHSINSYETLEFLGDAIVDLAVSDYLYKSNKYKEGEMTKIRASYVCENALYEYSMGLGFSDYVKLGVGEQKSGSNCKKAILADIFEAFIAAIYLDLGFEKAKNVALGIIVPYIEDKNVLLFSDYKSELQEAVQTTQKAFSYEILEESGPSHNKFFKVALKVDGMVYGIGSGGSKKEAEQEAAKAALKVLAKK